MTRLDEGTLERGRKDLVALLLAIAAGLLLALLTMMATSVPQAQAAVPRVDRQAE
ncbi:MAG TPA: hypothetical protein VHM16_02485 [Rubrobacteraceae bacterium]|nr:hypothetical protein [Rubrobacteraceae bacterium]